MSDKPYYELFDRYVAAVGRRLPAKNRADVAAELRSLLEDMLEDRSQEQDRPVDEEMAVALLKAFGSPGEVAARYSPPRYLIGPQLYPIFIKVAGIVLGVVTALNVISLAISLQGVAGGDLLQVLFHWALELVSSAFSTAGSVALIFAILERTLPAEEFASAEAEWDPRKLPAVKSEDRLKYVERVLDIIWYLAGIVILNLYREKLGIVNMVDGRWVMIPLVASTFLSFLPVLNIRWALGIVFNAVLIGRTRWETWSRWVSIGLSLFSVGILYAMIVSGPLLALPADWAEELDMTAETVETIEMLFSSGLHISVDIALGVALVVTAAQAIRQAVRLLRPLEGMTVYTFPGRKNGDQA